MEYYWIVKTLHILSAAILFGTGIGIAFFMFRSYFTNDLTEKHYAARGTVLADSIFTFPAVVIQPVTGFWLVWKAGYDWFGLWLVATYAIYIVAGLCWLPVVWIQIKMRNMLSKSIRDNTPLPARFNTLFWCWFILGWPAFLGLIAVFYLMVTKPV